MVRGASAGGDEKSTARRESATGKKARESLLSVNRRFFFASADAKKPIGDAWIARSGGTRNARRPRSRDPPRAARGRFGDARAIERAARDGRRTWSDLVVFRATASLTASALMTPRAMTRLALARPARRMAAVERTWAGATAKLADMADIFEKVSLNGVGGAERRAGRRRPEEWRKAISGLEDLNETRPLIGRALALGKNRKCTSLISHNKEEMESQHGSRDSGAEIEISRSHCTHVFEFL